MNMGKIDTKTTKINIEKIAEIAGVSPSTVSRALRDDPRANKKTKDRIIKLAEELNYHPNFLAKGLRTKITKTIGVIFSNLINPFISEILKGIEEILLEKGYSIIVFDSNLNIEQEKRNIYNMISRGVDGVIMTSITKDAKPIEMLIDHNIPIFLLDAGPIEDKYNYCYTNHKNAGYIGTKYLIEMGHKRIGYFGVLGLVSSEEFYKGYLLALNEAGINVDYNLIVYAGISIEDGYQSTLKLIRNGIDFTSIICVSDLSAIGIYKAVTELKKKIPDDISVCGYDDIETAQFLNPPLTTIRQSKVEIGKDAARALLMKIKNPLTDRVHKILEPELIVRGSVSKLKRQK
ncbi:MAG: LacI family transcriptional regulator [Actinobacteria bacterium]|nr:LacI family transcriptional regulator [Actinomycetota bacterium]MCL5986999.1 LacI family transcriptional regulator [Actinomycetota bacterium]